MAEQDREVRMVADCELRAVGDGDNPTRLEGYAALFNSTTELWDGYFETIAPGAFSRTLREGADVRALFNHDANLVLGRNKAGTLDINEDKKGLWVTIRPPATQAGRDVLTNVRNGNVSQMSFAFRAIKTSDEDKGKDGWLRTLEDVDLLDVSPVTYPQYTDTTVVARQFEERTGMKPKFRTEGTTPDGDATVGVVGEPKTTTEHNGATKGSQAKVQKRKSERLQRESEELT